jgi:hypothetical protein
MPFQLSPGVAVVEKDFSSIVPAVSSSSGAFAGVFAWGPVLDPVTISSENLLVSRFGQPNDTDTVFQSFFTAANFLGYTNNLLVVRADSTLARNAVVSGTPIKIKNFDDYTTNFSTGQASVGEFAAKYPGSLGNSLKVAMCDQNTWSQTVTAATTAAIAATTVSTTGTVGAITGTGPWTATITGMSSTTGLVVGSTITATAGTGTLFGGSPTSVVVASIIDATSITYTVTGGTTPTAGTITNVNTTSTTMTVSAVASGSLKVGQTLSGANISTGTTLVSQLTATGSAVVTPTFASGGVAGTNQLAVSSATGILVGQFVSGTGIAANSYVTSIIGTTVTLSNNFTSTVSGTISFYTAGGVGTYRVSISQTAASATVNATGQFLWAYASEFDSKPTTSSFVSTANGANDEMHIVVIDEDGYWSGVQGTVLEKFAYVSKASDAKKSDGTNNYYVNVINSQSRYVWWMDHPVGSAVTTTVNGVGTLGATWGVPAMLTQFKDLTAPLAYSLGGGVDDFTATTSQLQNAYSLFANAELYDISLVMTGSANATVSKYVVQNVAEYRKDCVAFVSPTLIADGKPILGNSVTAIADILAYRNDPSFNVDSSYAVLDSGFKYQYDRYNDKYRYVPLNGDVAGLCARTDYTDDPWFSPGGLNRGQIKNVVKLAINPNKTDRDLLYKAGINPVVNFPGQGTVLFGDKTLQSKPSAFDRINVRRLFIVLEKAIATAAKFQLFEFNDSFTRAQFKNLVEPFLRDVQGRRGVTDFRIKCDDANNTGEVIDRNEFVADIFIKPARSINFITLNFVAARSAVSFEEIGS